MKKRNFKSLKLNKQSISIFEKDMISGGTVGVGTIGTFCGLISNVIECPSRTCISTANSGDVVRDTCANCDQ